MIKVLLVYFSGTGMTRYYASLIQDEMHNRGFVCDCQNLEEFVDVPTLWQKKPVALNYTIRAEYRRPLSKYPWPYQTLKSALGSVAENPALSILGDKWNDYDLIGFGSPVYGFRPAPVMIRFLLDLPVFKGKIRAFSFATHDGAQGDFENYMDMVLALKGFKVVGHIGQSFIYSAMAVMQSSFNHRKSGRLLVKKSYQARMNILGFIEYIHSIFYGIPYSHRASFYGTPYSYHSTDLISRMAGLPWRLIYSFGIDFLLNHFLFGFGIHKEDCILCMSCVRQCPQGLIEIDEEGYPVRYYHCMYCLRCLNWCPTDALYFSKATEGKARFPGPDVLLEAALQDGLDMRLRNK